MKKRLSLPPKLSKIYDACIDWKYFGQQIMESRYEEKSNDLITTKRIVACNTIKSLNFWADCSGKSSGDKKNQVIETWRMYGSGEIEWSETLSFCNTISKTKIQQHNLNQDTFYYVSRHDASISNIMLDWDDKESIWGDTEAAAKWVNQKFFHGQSFIQSSTSGTGTHQYLFIETENVSVGVQKALYARLIALLRVEVHSEGFRCSEGLDRVKGIGCEISWDKNGSKSISVGGIFAKFPRLGTSELVDRFCDRKIIAWKYLVHLVETLEQKQKQGNQQDEGKEETVYSLVPEGSFIYDTPVIDINNAVTPKSVRNSKLLSLLRNSTKQQASLASVFIFQNMYDRRATPSDFADINKIYSTSDTATGLELTQKRIERFQCALDYAKNNDIIKKSLFDPSDMQKAAKVFGTIDLTEMNRELVSQRQRKITSDELARVWLYFRFKHRELSGQVPYKSLLGFCKIEEQGKKIGKELLTRILRFFVQRDIIEIAERHDQWNHRCRQYKILHDPIEHGTIPESQIIKLSETPTKETECQNPEKSSLVQPSKRLRGNILSPLSVAQSAKSPSPDASEAKFCSTSSPTCWTIPEPCPKKKKRKSTTQLIACEPLSPVKCGSNSTNTEAEPWSS